MSPDEQAAAKQRMRERYETLSPEQQAQVRQRMQERRAARPQ
jgi:Spy/CpxP family protein refolding chaperone